MISKEDIKKLADLARIQIYDSEVVSLAGEMDAILGYVGQIQSVTNKETEEIDENILRNVLREDIEPTESGKYSKELVAEFPEEEKNYLKVKKIL